MLQLWKYSFMDAGQTPERSKLSRCKTVQPDIVRKWPYKIMFTKRLQKISFDFQRGSSCICFCIYFIFVIIFIIRKHVHSHLFHFFFHFIPLHVTFIKFFINSQSFLYTSRCVSFKDYKMCLNPYLFKWVDFLLSMIF